MVCAYYSYNYNKIILYIESTFMGHKILRYYGPYNSKVFGCVMFRVLRSHSHVVMFCVNVFASDGTLLPPSQRCVYVLDTIIEGLGTRVS